MAVDLLKPLKVPRGAFSTDYTRGRGLVERIDVYFINASGSHNGPLRIDGHHVVKMRIPPGFVKVYDAHYIVEYAQLNQFVGRDYSHYADRSNASRIQIHLA